MRRSLILLATMGASALLVAAAVLPRVGQAAPAPAGPSGAYAFSLSTHDANTGQEGNGVGTMVFDGAGIVSGTISENERFNPPCNTCGDLLVTHAPYTGTYTMRPDGSVLIDMCISNPSGSVRVVLEGAFSNAFRSLRFLVSEIGNALGCTATLTQVPNITSGTADKL